MTEKSLQTKLVKYLKEKKIPHIKIITAGTAGWPDYICCMNGGFFVGIECKTDIGKQTPLQKYRQTEIEWAGGRYILLTPENFKEVFP